MQRNHILLVEDNLADVELVKITLRDIETPVNIVILRDGEELLEYLRTHSLREIGLVLLDLNMPRLNGFEVLAALREHEQWSLLPAIVFSTSTSVGDIRKSYELGAKAYVAKPLDITDYNFSIMAIIRFWLRVNIVPDI